MDQGFQATDVDSAPGWGSTDHSLLFPQAHVAQWQGVGCQSEVYQCKEGCSAAHDVVAQTHTWGSCPSFSRFTSRVISLNLYPVFSWHISPIAHPGHDRKMGTWEGKESFTLTPDSGWSLSPDENQKSQDNQNFFWEGCKHRNNGSFI